VDDGVLRFTVPGQPEGLPRHRTVIRHGRIYQVADRKGEAYKARIRAHYLAACSFRPRVRGGPVTLMLRAVATVPPSWSKRRREAALAGLTAWENVPDGDNIWKVVGDALNGYAWRDDRHIVSGTVHKSYGARAELVVEIRDWKSGD